MTPLVQNEQLIYHQDGQSSPIPVGSPAWFQWLETASRFLYRSQYGTFSARLERASNNRGGMYWRAYRKHAGKLHRVYLGKSGELTLQRLQEAATLLLEHMDVERASTDPVPDLSKNPHEAPEEHLLSHRDLPTGTLTLLLTDIEGSTRLLQELGDSYAAVLMTCRRLLRTIFEQHQGYEVDTQGDSFFIVFTRVTDAIAAAVAVQRTFDAYSWPHGLVVRVRMGLHTGEPQRVPEGYVGLDVHKAARIMSAGHGGQVLLSPTTRELVEYSLPPGVSIRDLGEYVLKDIDHPICLSQLVIEGISADFPSLKAVEPTVEQNSLLATKLSLPRPRTQLVLRSRLVERLEQSLKHELTLVSAPTGFGKTTLLAQWLAESNTPVAWLSLELEDNDPARFLTYLIAALQTHHPTLGVTILELLKTSQATPLERALTALTNDIVNQQLTDFVLVLDDYHVITNEAIHRAMHFLIEHLPPSMHLLLATRADPPLPLSRLRARGQLIELRAADMRMNTPEVHYFLHDVMELDIPAHAISDIESRTEGWVAGLQLAALCLQGRPDISTFLAAFTGSHRFVLDYLSEEVLSRQPPSVLSFLLQTSILKRLSGSLCDAVTAQDGGQAMLEALDKSNLFTNALDDQRHWYRYHHLFADVLRNQLHQTQPTLVPELHRRASLWYEQHEQAVEAVNHALAAGDVEGAIRLIEHAVTSLFAHGQTRTVLEWLNALPTSAVRTHPLLAVSHATALHLIDHIEQAEARLHDAEHALTPQTPSELARIVRGIVANVRANIARYSGDISGYISLGLQASELLAESDVMLQAAPRMQVAHAYMLDGDVTPAMEQRVRDAVMLASTADYPLVHFRSLVMLARFQMLQGRLNDTALTYEEAGQAVPGTQVLQVLTASAAYSFGLADLLREWNRLDEAEHLLAQGMSLIQGRQSVFADDIWLGTLTQARLQCARGTYNDALATINTFLQLAKTRNFVPQLQTTAMAVRAHIMLTVDSMPEDLRWMKEYKLSHLDAELSYVREREYLTLARLFLAQGREHPAKHFFEDALHLLSRLLQDAQAKGRSSSILEILLLQALVLHAQGERSHALTVLEQVLTLALPERYIRLFVDEGVPMQTLLRQYHPERQSQLASYATLLLAAFDEQGITASSVPFSPNSLPEPLTEREREVLHLLMQGNSNGDIARRLVLSINTVKRHIYNICGKLGVQTRTQAIVKARTLNLL